MLEIDKRIIDFSGSNSIKVHTVALDEDLDCIIAMSIKDKNIEELLFWKVLDSVIDTIHPKNVYKDFQSALENINAFLETLSGKNERVKGLHACVWIYHKKTLFFSTIGRASCYLYNMNNDVIEITDKSDHPHVFSHILSWDIASGESVLVGTTRVLDTLSKDDIKESFLSERNIHASGDVLEHTLTREDVGKNIGLMMLRKTSHENEVSSLEKYYESAKYFSLKLLDNSMTKKILSHVYILKNKILEKSQNTQQYIFALGFVISVAILYFVISWFFSFTSSTGNVNDLKIQLITAQNHVISASENTNNEDMFALNIESAIEIIDELKKQEMFLWDIEKLDDEISILQKQFNGIAPFSVNDSNTLYTFENPKNITKIVNVSWKIYIVHDRSITGPIIAEQTAEEYVFEDLRKDDRFVDAAVYGTNIVMVTQNWKVVNFAKNNFFNFSDVSGQDTWENSPIVASYVNNVYMLADSKKQILMHRKSGNSFTQWVSYLSDEDAASIWEIYSLAIDGGIYILKKDGTIVKLFRSPKYRLESLSLNNLPKNYDFNNLAGYKTPSIQAWITLNGVYMLYKNKILVLEANSNRFQDTKALNYMWQIEGKDMVIEEFHVKNDGEIILADEDGVYKLEYEIIDEDIVLR